MASVYILFSEEKDRYYIGSCKDLYIRLDQHKRKVFENAYTKNADDWSLYYSVDGLSYTQARLIEQHIKLMKSRKYYKNLQKHPEIMEKLKVKYNKY